jgi:hypothetical protein
MIYQRLSIFECMGIRNNDAIMNDSVSVGAWMMGLGHFSALFVVCNCFFMMVFVLRIPCNHVFCLQSVVL